MYTNNLGVSASLNTFVHKLTGVSASLHTHVHQSTVNQQLWCQGLTEHFCPQLHKLTGVSASSNTFVHKLTGVSASLHMSTNLQ